MMKNETKLNTRRARVTNNYVEAPPGAKRAWCHLAYCQRRWRRSFPSVRGRKTQLATVSGTIADPSGAVVPGVSVTIVSQGIGLKRSALTDTAGEYGFAGLPPGTIRFAWRKQDSNRRFAKESSSIRCRSDDKFATRDSEIHRKLRSARTLSGSITRRRLSMNYFQSRA
jgi:hypothetical protein